MQYPLCAKKAAPEIKWSMLGKFLLKFRRLLSGSALSYEDLYPLYKLADYQQFPPFESGWNVIKTVNGKESHRLAAYYATAVGQLLNTTWNFI